jgi:hypothetical protein
VSEEDKTTGLVMAAVFLGIGGAAAYWIWPEGITDLPLASIKFGGLLRAIGSGVIAFIALCLAVSMLDS